MTKAQARLIIEQHAVWFPVSDHDMRSRLSQENPELLEAYIALVEFSKDRDEQFNIGDQVEWESQANSSWTTKRGEIVAIVFAGHHPREILDSNEFAKYNRAALDGTTEPRNHMSYLVAVKPSGSAKPKLYWPRVSKLKLV